MRIIAGKNGSRKLKAVAGKNTRPTADRVKEGVFSTIAARLPDAEVLDVFGGTGAIALEALSRGARRAVIIEKNKAALEVIRANITACGETDCCQVLAKDALTALAQLAAKKAAFDVIYIDPPYQAKLYESVLAAIADGCLLKTNGVIVCECAKNYAPSWTNETFCLIKERYYGDTVIIYLTHKAAKEE